MNGDDLDAITKAGISALVREVCASPNAVLDMTPADNKQHVAGLISLAVVSAMASKLPDSERALMLVKLAADIESGMILDNIKEGLAARQKLAASEGGETPGPKPPGGPMAH